MSDPNLDDLRRNLADATLSTEQMGAEILGLRESVSELAIKRRVDEQHHILQRRMVEAKRDDWERLCLSYIGRLHKAEAERDAMAEVVKAARARQLARLGSSQNVIDAAEYLDDALDRFDAARATKESK